MLATHTADRRTELKIKIKTLAAESRIIRLEERKAKAKARMVKRSEAKAGLRERCSRLGNHRKTVVRQAARAAYIAYAFISGRSYKSTEDRVKIEPEWRSVARNVVRFLTPYGHIHLNDVKMVNGTMASVEEWAKEV